MTTRQENTFTMWQVVNTLLATNQAIWLLIPAIAEAIERFQIHISEVTLQATAQSFGTIGTTGNKKQAAAALISEAVSISELIQSYATAKNNLELFNDMAYPKSKLDRIADTELVTKTTLIHTTASELLLGLANFGINAGKLTAFLTLISNYQALLTSPRQRQVLIKEASQALSASIKAGNKELKNIDKLMSNFKTSNLAFYNQYFISRIIIDLGATTTVVKILVNNATTNAFVPNASISNNLNDITLVSNTQGKAKVKIPFGTYNFTATAQGFQTLTLSDIKVKLGQTTTLKFLLQQS